MPERPRTVLVKTCCLGDVLLATPLAAALAAHVAGGVVDWAVDRHSLPALANNPAVGARLDGTGCVRGAWRPGGLARLTLALRAGRYDLALVPERSPLLGLLPRLAGIPHRVGLDSGGRGRWHTLRVPVPPDRHEAELYLDLARALGLRPGPPRLVFRPTRADQLVARRALAGLLAAEPALEAGPAGPVPAGGSAAAGWGSGRPVAGGPLVVAHLGGGVNPGQTLLEKRWPAACWAELLDRLAAGFGARLVLLGGPGDRAYVAELRRALAAPALDLAGTLAWGEAGAVIQMADLYLGHDTGASHLATAVGAPAVVLFGPTSPARYGPLPGTGLAVAPAGGAVDRLADARGSSAMRDLPVARVWEACAAQLAGA